MKLFSARTPGIVIAAVGVILLSSALLVAHPAYGFEAPVITSVPPANAVTTDGTYVYQAQVQTAGPQTDLSYSLAHQPEGMTVDAQGKITWQPRTPGDYRIVLDVADSLGNASQPFRVTVVLGAPVKIAIEPNNQPTPVKTGATVQFIAKAFDAKGNSASVDKAVWSTDGSIGSISPDGLFSAQKKGAGHVTARVGTITSTIAVSVTGSQVKSPAPQGKVLGTSTEPGDQNTNANSEPQTGDTLQAAPQSQAQANPQASCTNWRQWIIIAMLIVYALALILYYKYMAKRSNSLWWLFPTLLTVIGLIIYSRYMCVGTYVWWPWVLLLLGIVITFISSPHRAPANPA